MPVYQRHSIGVGSDAGIWRSDVIGCDQVKALGLKLPCCVLDEIVALCRESDGDAREAR